jgi:RNA polymerase sigma-70 factor (ECF subfamily)
MARQIGYLQRSPERILPECQEDVRNGGCGWGGGPMVDATLRSGHSGLAERTQQVAVARGAVVIPETARERQEKRANAPLTDEDAHLAAAAHDPRAFAPVYEAYFPLVHTYCLRRLRDPERAADATSQVFINAIQSLPRFRPRPDRPGSSFRSWLFSIAHNVAIDAVRRAGRHQARNRSIEWTDLVGDEDVTSLSDRLADSNPTPEEWVLEAESRLELASLLETLPERQRAIVEFRLAGLSNAEIAEALAMSYSAVRSAQYRAFVELRRLLDPARHTSTERTS